MVYVSNEKKKEYYEIIKNYCVNNNLKLIESAYKGYNFKHKALCENNHTIFIKFRQAYMNRIFSCKECCFKKLKDYCKTKNGLCLENKYKGTNHCYKCKCSNGHEFMFRYS